MKSKASSAKSAKVAKAIVLTGNGVSNQKSEQNPIIVLPTAHEAKPEVKEQLTKQDTPVNAEKQMSIDALMDKADRSYLLRQKYQEVKEKRRLLDSFAISHDQDNAQLTLIDAKGLRISTSNPATIGKLLADWMIDLNIHLKKTEGEIRTELEMYN